MLSISLLNFSKVTIPWIIQGSGTDTEKEEKNKSKRKAKGKQNEVAKWAKREAKGRYKEEEKSVSSAPLRAQETMAEGG